MRDRLLLFALAFAYQYHLVTESAPLFFMQTIVTPSKQFRDVDLTEGQYELQSQDGSFRPRGNSIIFTIQLNLPFAPKQRY
jgi:hypothetical protein